MFYTLIEPVGETGVSHFEKLEDALSQYLHRNNIDNEAKALEVLYDPIVSIEGGEITGYMNLADVMEIVSKDKTAGGYMSYGNLLSRLKKMYQQQEKED